MDNTEKTKRPAFQFYPADWRKDVELQSCSMAAQGLWINAMCIAHECEPYGHLMINGRPMNTAQLGRQVGLSQKECEALITELHDAGVVRRTPEGVLFSKRMVQDEATRNARAAGGKSGAEHGAKGASHGKKGGRPTQTKGGSETPLDPKPETPLEGAPNPPPSSSSSSSTSVNSSVAKATGGESPPSPPPPQKSAAEVEKARLWRLVKTVLVEQEACDSTKAAGVLAGAMASKYGNDVFLEAARAMESTNPVDAHTYLIGLCETAAGKRQSLNKQEALEQRNRSVADAWAAEGDDHATH